MVDNRYYDLVAISDLGMAHPAFKKFSEADSEISNNKYISYPIRDTDGIFISTIQVESKYVVLHQE